MPKQLIYNGTYGRDPETDSQPVPELGVFKPGQGVVITEQLVQSLGRDDPDAFAEMVYGIYVPEGAKYPRFSLKDVPDDQVDKTVKAQAKDDHAQAAAAQQAQAEALGIADGEPSTQGNEAVSGKTAGKPKEGSK